MGGVLTTPFDDIEARSHARVGFGEEADDYAERHAVIAVELEEEHPEWTAERVDREAHKRCGHTFGGEFTILIADERVGKTYRRGPDGWTTVGSYPDVYRWRVKRRHVHDLDELAAELEVVADFGRACVIRGYPLRDFGSEPTRRLVYPCTRTDDEPTFVSVPEGLRWMCIDVDGLPCDIDPRVDPDGYADVARQALPDSLKRGRCFYQLSASAGIKPGVRVHLWFWLERRAHDDALRHWADETPNVDPSVFGTVQPHYLAPPLFIAANPDPEEWGEVTLDDIFERRTGFLPGTAEVWPDGLMGVMKWNAYLEQQEHEAEVRKRMTSNRAKRMWQNYEQSDAGKQRRGAGALKASVRAILDATEGNRNTTICRKANFLGRVVAEGSLGMQDARVELAHAAEQALGSEWSARRQTTLEAIERCLASGFAAGGS